MDSAQLFRFLSRPRSIAEVAERFGLTLEQAERLVREALLSGKLVVEEAESGKSPVEGRVRGGQSLSFLPKSSGLGKATGMPRIRSWTHSKNYPWSKYRNLRFKFKEAMPSSVKQVQALNLLGVPLKERGGRSYRSTAYVSLPLETRVLDSLTMGPKTLMDLRVAFAVSRRNLEKLERTGLVESFWGSKGVGRMFRITEKGSMELKRLNMASSVDRKMVEKPLMSMRKITARLLA